MQPARSRSRAAWSKSAARSGQREGPTSGVTLASPRDCRVRKVLQLSGDRLREQVVDCGQVLKDLQRNPTAVTAPNSVASARRVALMSWLSRDRPRARRE